MRFLIDLWGSSCFEWGVPRQSMGKFAYGMGFFMLRMGFLEEIWVSYSLNGFPRSLNGFLNELMGFFAQSGSPHGFMGLFEH